MKRQLTKQEKELTIKGIDFRKKKIEETKKALNITKLHKEFLIKKREYEDAVRPFNREAEDKELEKTIKGYSEELKISEDTIKELENQLNNGVEQK